MKKGLYAEKSAASNEHIGEIAVVCPQKRQCKLESYYPARTFVKPLPRQAAGTLVAILGQRKTKGKLIKNKMQ